MAEWRFLRGWNETELQERLEKLALLCRNFALPDDPVRPERGWKRQHSESTVAREGPGPPEEGGPFCRLQNALRQYAFSDPRIVRAYFDPAASFEGRRMLLEIRILGLRYLCGVVVAAVQEENSAEADCFGFRYETLEGHLEAGWEWFVIRKDHATGEIRFSIEARWQEGEFPNFWTRLGFHLIARRMQRRWHQLAHHRMASYALGQGTAPDTWTSLLFYSA